MDLDLLLKQVSDHAKHVLLTENQPSLMPMYHIVGDEELVVGCPWRNEREKLLTLQAIKKTAREVNATMIAFLCEMWVTRHDPGTDPLSVGPPSQSPDRAEGVLAVATDGTETKVNFWRIVRSRPDGPIIALTLQKDTKGIFAGRMIDGLLPHKPHSLH